MSNGRNGKSGCSTGLGCVALGCAVLVIVGVSAGFGVFALVRQAGAWARADLAALDTSQPVAEARALALVVPGLELPPPAAAPGAAPFLVPDWVPAYPAGSLRGWDTTYDETTKAGSYELVSDDSVEVVAGHFKEALERAGLDQGARSMTWQVGGRAGATLAGRDGARQFVLRLVSTESGTLISARYRELATSGNPGGS